MYTPPFHLLQKYADLLVNYSLGHGHGVMPGETVLIRIPDFALPMFKPLQNAVLKAGAFPIPMILMSSAEPDFVRLANEAQLEFAPMEMWEGIIRQIDHHFYFKPYEELGTYDGLPPTATTKRQQSLVRFRPLQNKKEDAGKVSWALAWYGTQSYAEAAGMSPQQYWDAIFDACLLNEEDPIAAWKSQMKETTRIAQKLTAMHIRRIHVMSEDTDIWHTLGESRRWLTGTGHNMPTAEIYTSQDSRYTSGKMSFNQPLYLNGTRISGISFVFERGQIIEAHATENEEILLAILDSEPEARRLGEFSLTDERHSRITQPMCCTLFDENMGGNTHIAFGASYRATYDGDPTQLLPEEWNALGFNNPDAKTHVDVISTTPRIVEVDCGGGAGSMTEIYRDHRFTI